VSAYYPATYNRLADGTPITKGLAVQVVDVDYIDPTATTVLHTGTVVGFDNRKAAEGYTVLIATADGTMSARPDELRVPA
jgi:hypothetical protein